MKILTHRLTALLLAILMVLGWTASALGESGNQAPQNINLFINEMAYNTENAGEAKYPSAATTLGDSLYILTNNTLERWSPGLSEAVMVLDKLPTRLPSDTEGTDGPAPEGEPIYFSRLFTEGGRVLALDTNTGEVWALADGTEGFSPAKAVALEWDAMVAKEEEYSYFNKQLLDILALDGTLYLAVIDYSVADSHSALYRWDMETGKAQPPIEKTDIQSISPYRDGQLLCVLFDQMNGWDEAAQKIRPSQLATLNLETGALTTLFDLTGDYIYGLCYNADNDTAYYSSRGTVYSLPSLQPTAKISAYLPNMSWADASQGLLSGTMYYTADYSGVAVRELDAPGVEKGALVIAGSYDSRMHNQFLIHHPEILTSVSDAYYNTLEGFASAMVSGAGAVDVYGLSASYAPLQKLIDKGYAMDLSGSPALMETVNAMYPAIVQDCMRDGKLYALPVSMNGSTPGYDPEIWEELGFDEDELPTTMYELLDFAANWDAEEYPDINLFDDPNWRNALLYFLNDQYMAYLSQQNLPMSFDTDLYRKLLGRIDSMEKPPIVESDGNRDEYYEEYWSRKALFTLYQPISYFYISENQQYLILPLDEGMDVVLPVNLDVLIVNPKTTRAEEALLYLTNAVGHYEEESANITLFPGHNEPVPNRTFEESFKLWTEELDKSRKMLETASPEDVASLRSSVEYLEKLVADPDQYRYNVSAEKIEYYRQNIAPYLYVVGQTPFQQWDQNGENEFYTLIQQYLDGAISADQYVKDVSKRLRMMTLEDQ